MSKRVRDEEEALAQVRAVAPLELLELGPEMLAEIFERVLTLNPTALSTREVNTVFAAGFKETVALHIIALLEEAGRAYDAWHGLTMASARVCSMFHTLARESHISLQRMLPGFLKGRTGRGQVWLNAYTMVAGIATTDIVPTESSRETRVMAWLLFLRALPMTLHESALHRHRLSTPMLFYVAASPLLPASVLPSVDMMPMDSAVLPEDLLRYYRGAIRLADHGLAEAREFWRTLKGPREDDPDANWMMTELMMPRFPTVQDWCAYQLTLGGHDVATLRVFTTWAALPRPREPVAVAKSLYEILGPVTDIVQVNGSTLRDVINWLRVFNPPRGERLTPAQHEKVLSTLGLVLLDKLLSTSDTDDAGSMHSGLLSEIIEMLSWDDALAVISHVSPTLSFDWPEWLDYSFRALSLHHGLVPGDIWNLTFTTPPHIPVFDTATGGWLHHLFVYDEEFNTLAFRLPELEPVFVVMPASRQMPITFWYKVLYQRMFKYQTILDVDEGLNLVAFTRLFARYLGKQPFDITVVLRGVYDCAAIEDYALNVPVDILDILLPPGIESAEVARAAIATLSDLDMRNVLTDLLTRVLLKRARWMSSMQTEPGVANRIGVSTKM